MLSATGYEALILSFGSHCNMEDSSAENIAKWRKLVDYAHSKGILIGGGYSLFSSRRISDEDDDRSHNRQTGCRCFLVMRHAWAANGDSLISPH